MATATKRRVEGKVTPEVLNAILLDEVAGRLDDLNISFQRFIPFIDRFARLEERLERVERAIRERTPEGVLVPQTVTFSGTKVLDFTTEPLFTFSIYNDGPGDIYVGVNETPLQEVPIHERESYDCPIAKRGAVRTIYLICEEGSSATIRLYGVR